MITLNNRQVVVLFISGLLLLVPLVAMQLTSEVYWTTMDFVVAGALLLTTGLTMEWIMRKVVKKSVRAVLIAIGIVLFLLVWAELAVGIFGTPFAGD